MKPRLTPHPWKCFETPLRLADEEAVRALPDYHIVCTSTLPYRDKALMGAARAAGRLWDVDTGHDLMITEPAFVADALAKISDAPRGGPA